MRGVPRGGPGACPTGKFLNLESLKCHFLDFGGRFDRNLMVRKRDYNVSKFAIWLEFCINYEGIKSLVEYICIKYFDLY